MFFVGTYELTIDGKSRLSVPHAIRSKINSDADGRAFYVVPGFRNHTLALYPERYFEKLRAFVPPVERLSDRGHAWRQYEYSQSALLDPDSQGRILIPERMLKRFGIGREVVLIGVQDHLELWNQAEFDAFESAIRADAGPERSDALKELAELKRELNGAASTAAHREG